MNIDGNPVTANGTLVVPSSARAELSLPFGKFELIFRPEANLNMRLTTNPMQITFDGTDNPLGVSSTFKIPLTTGSVNLTIAVYALGSGSDTTRVIHFTVS
jgi:hypothetical protein